MSDTQKITTFLWFDGKAEEAANHYTSIFKNSKILSVSRYGEAGPGPKGTAMTVLFQLEGQQFIALNGGPQFKFTEAISYAVFCLKKKKTNSTPGRRANPKSQRQYPCNTYVRLTSSIYVKK